MLIRIIYLQMFSVNFTNLFYEDTYQLLGDVDDVRTLQHENELLVQGVYYFFQSICSSPSVALSNWPLLFHEKSVNDCKN
jgi:hypothetical protein